MGEADVRDPVGRVLAVLRDAGRAEPTVQSYRVVLERFAAFLVERGLETASDRVGVEFVEEQTGVRLESLREPVTDRRVRAVRRAVVLMVDVLAGRPVEVDRPVIPVKDVCPVRFRPVRDEYVACCRDRGNAEATVATKDKAASRFLAYLEDVGVDDLVALGVRDVSGFLLRLNAGLDLAARRSPQCARAWLTSCGSWRRPAGHRAVWRTGCRRTGMFVTSPSRTCGPRMRFAGCWP